MPSGRLLLLGKLHPAVRRPGRCLAEIEVPRLTRSAAREWLGGATPLVADSASLAELFAIAGGAAPAEPNAPVAVGQYL